MPQNLSSLPTIVQAPTFRRPDGTLLVIAGIAGSAFGAFVYFGQGVPQYMGAGYNSDTIAGVVDKFNIVNSETVEAANRAATLCNSPAELENQENWLADWNPSILTNDTSVVAPTPVAQALAPSPSADLARDRQPDPIEVATTLEAIDQFRNQAVEALNGMQTQINSLRTILGA